MKINLPSNCYIWCGYMYLRYGGTIKFYRSLTWAGYHSTWVAPNGVEWEYTVRRMRRVPWYYIPIIYYGVIKKVKPETNKK